MLKQFPLRLAFRTFITILIVTVVVYNLISGIYGDIRNTASAIQYYYSGVNEKMQSRIQKEKALLADLEQKIASPTNSEKMSTGYYDFIREIFAKKGVQTIKIASGEPIMKENAWQEDFSTTFTSTYHTVGMIISDLENGPFFCSVKSVHLVSKSLTGNTLEVSMVFSFSRVAG